MNTHIQSYLVAFGVLIVSVAPSDAKTVKAFILSGQSNMDGHGPTASLPPELREPLENVRYFIGSQWHDLQPLASRVGPEISFGRAMAAAWPDEEIAIIKYAVGGTSLLAWDPYWEVWAAKLTGDDSRGSLYRVLMSELDIAHQEEGLEIDIVGMLWMQGESDALVEGPANDYFENFREFIEVVRRDVGRPNMPFVFGRISQAAVWIHQDVVRDAQARTERDIPFTKMVDTDDLPFIADDIHYNAEGQVTLGQRFAEAMLEVHEDAVQYPQASRSFDGAPGPLFGWFSVGQMFPDTRIALHVPAGPADTTVRETIPLGWRVENLRPNAGTATVEGNAVVWQLPGFVGEAELLYDLRVLSGGDDGVVFSGTVESGGLQAGINGVSRFHAIDGLEAPVPLLANAVTLDGVLGTAEWEGAYVIQLDRANKLAPGVAITGPLFPLEESRASVHLFHTETHLYVAVDVIDPFLDFTSGRVSILNVDSVILEVDGNLSRARAENNEFGLEAGVVGDGSSAGRSTQRPTIEALPDGGHHSTDGTLWNFGARPKDDGSGYIAEFAIDKSKILDPPARRTLGFDVKIHDAIGTGQVPAKWGWHFLDEESGIADDAPRVESLWGRIHLLDGALSSVSEWKQY